MQRLHARQVTSTERKPSDNYALVKYSAPPNFTVKYLRGKREKRTWELIWGARWKVWKCKSTVDFTESNSKGRHERETHLCMNRWKCQIFFFFALNPNFIMINCIQPQSESNTAATWRISKVQPFFCTGCRPHDVSVQPDRIWVISYVNRKKNKTEIKKRKKKRNTNSIGICKFLFSIARL